MQAVRSFFRSLFYIPANLMTFLNTNWKAIALMLFALLIYVLHERNNADRYSLIHEDRLIVFDKQTGRIYWRVQGEAKWRTASPTNTEE